MNMPDKLLKFSELLDYLNMSRSTVLKLMKEHSLPHYQIGTQYRFAKDEVIAWLKENSINDREELESSDL